jgi:hypothetical protein
MKSNNGVYIIKAQFGYCKENGEPDILSIVNYYAKKENGIFELCNALTCDKQK